MESEYINISLICKNDNNQVLDITIDSSKTIKNLKKIINKNQISEGLLDSVNLVLI